MARYRKTTKRSNKKSNRKPRPSTPAPFRLLDLPRELRDHIYEDMATVVFEVSVAIACSSSKGSRVVSVRRTGGRDDSCSLPQNRLSILLTNRQINEEATPIFRKNVRIDLEFAYQWTSERRILNFMRTFQPNLQFIRHIEMECIMANDFLFSTDRQMKKHPLDAEELFKYCSVPFSTNEHLIKFRPLLRNIESVLIYPDNYMTSITQFRRKEAVPWEVLIRLAHPQTRGLVSRFFPLLRDIKVVNRSGGERYRKMASGQWELWYSKAPIPLEMEWYFGFAGEKNGEEFDEETKLSAESTLRFIENPYADDEQSSEESDEDGEDDDNDSESDEDEDDDAEGGSEDDESDESEDDDNDVGSLSENYGDL